MMVQICHTGELKKIVKRYRKASLVFSLKVERGTVGGYFFCVSCRLLMRREASASRIRIGCGACPTLWRQLSLRLLLMTTLLLLHGRALASTSSRPLALPSSSPTSTCLSTACNGCLHCCCFRIRIAAACGMNRARRMPIRGAGSNSCFIGCNCEKGDLGVGLGWVGL
ncbi:Ilp6 [Drosophila busckii]|uniref:Ilp6 n=1 Tax=Drosophila busckii TaxID=30019 RepID=A0A0M4EVZ0_DROBS|nr:Ilp6 [Drosophila busckii]